MPDIFRKSTVVPLSVSAVHQSGPSAHPVDCPVEVEASCSSPASTSIRSSVRYFSRFKTPAFLWPEFSFFAGFKIPMSIFQKTQFAKFMNFLKHRFRYFEIRQNRSGNSLHKLKHIFKNRISRDRRLCFVAFVQEWSFEASKVGSKYLSKYLDIKRHNLIRWTFQWNGHVSEISQKFRCCLVLMPFCVAEPMPTLLATLVEIVSGRNEILSFFMNVLSSIKINLFE